MDNKAAAEKLNKVGDAFKEKGDYENAIQTYEQSRDLYTNMTALNGLAECQLKTSRSSEAFINAYLATNLQNMGLSGSRHVQDAELDKATELMHAAKEIEDAEKAKNAELADKCRQEGNTFFNKAQYAQAIDCYTKSIAANKTAVALANRAQAYLNIGNAQLALDDARAALKVDNKSFKAWYRSGEALFQLGRIAEALHAFEEAVRNGPPAASKLCNERISECKKKANSQKGKAQNVTAKKRSYVRPNREQVKELIVELEQNQGEERQQLLVEISRMPCFGQHLLAADMMSWKIRYLNVATNGSYGQYLRETGGP